MASILLHEFTRALGVFTLGGFVLEFIKEGLVSNSFDLHIAVLALIPLLLLDIFFILHNSS
ncbi:MAG: hypothetical protein WC659_04865 [Patescibacteria group bacterium]